MKTLHLILLAVFIFLLSRNLLLAHDMRSSVGCNAWDYTTLSQFGMVCPGKKNTKENRQEQRKRSKDAFLDVVEKAVTADVPGGVSTVVNHIFK